MPLNVIILAGGDGKRMCSDTPKPLHRLAGRTLLEHVVSATQPLNPQAIYVVYSVRQPQVKMESAHLNVHWIELDAPRGTAYATVPALNQIPDRHQVLVLYVDTPLIGAATLKRLVKAAQNDTVAWLTAAVENPTGLGRIVRDADNQACAIVEEADLQPEQHGIKEINSGVAVFPAGKLKRWLKKIDCNNRQGEYYLTDCFALAVNEAYPLTAIMSDDPLETGGINSRKELATLERIYQYRQAQQLMAAGVTLLDPRRFDLRGSLQCERDVTIDVNVIIEGTVRIGRHSVIGAGAYLRDTDIGEHVTVLPYSLIDGATVADRSRIGPFARIRPQTTLATDSRIGNFVEIKAARIGAGSKVNHLSYVGDAEIGQAVNIGAGTITCNYDGVNKHKTVIEDDAFIGSNNCLIAPVTVGARAATGASSAIRKSVPPDMLAVARSEQRLFKRNRKTAAKNK